MILVFSASLHLSVKSFGFDLLGVLGALVAMIFRVESEG